ncbi:MAG: fibronectin type III domain-containing protein [Acidobacteriia bacterium]|nr:fibronectin type III domain-containing protein [Terriglobia bacterium]
MRHLTLFLLLSAMALAQQGIQGKVQFTGSTTVKVTNHTVTLYWTASQDANTYTVYRGTIHGGPYTRIIAGVAPTTAIDQNVLHGMTYYYVVRAVNASGESGNSSEIVVSIP